MPFGEAQAHERRRARVAKKALVRVTTSTSIMDLESDGWNALTGRDDLYLSHSWLAAVQQDRTARAIYLVAWNGNKLVGALPLYHVFLEGNAFYHPDRYNSLLGVDGDYLVAGGRRGYRAGLLLSPDMEGDLADEITEVLLREALDVAAQSRMGGLVFLYAPTSVIELLGRVASIRGAFDTAEAVLHLEGGGTEGYLGQLPAKRRYTARKEMRAFATFSGHCATETLSQCLPEAARLVANVERRHGHQVTDAAMARILGHQERFADAASVVFTLRDDSGRLVSCSLFHNWRGTLFNRAVGFDYDALGPFNPYFSDLVYRPVQWASENGADRIHLGITSCRGKVQRGAVLRPLWSAVIPMSGPESPFRRPGVHILDAGAAERWRDEYACFSRALPPGAWRLPGSCPGSISQGGDSR